MTLLEKKRLQYVNLVKMKHNKRVLRIKGVKLRRHNRGDGSVKENEIVLSDSNKGISKHPTISQNLLVNNQKNTNSALHCLSSETLDGLSLPAASQISGKGKKKKKPGVTISESCAVSVKEKHTVPVQEGGRPSSQGVDMSDTDTTNEKNRHVPPELATASAANKKEFKEYHP
ncbi:hypothetical protein OIU78_004152 [Salix suchowensis]|nr:hypothetical protein OIU78_004152 [Salix suchowensis]